MTTSLEQLWAELEADPTPDMPGNLRRRIHTAASLPMYLELSVPDGHRSIALEVPGDVRIGRLPERTRSIDCRLIATSAGRRIQVTLSEPELNPLFAQLAADLTQRAADAATPTVAVFAWTARLRLWQRLLQRVGGSGLGPEQQRGLYGEIHLLRFHLIPALGPLSAIAGWTGPDGAPHDFQYAGGALEAKTSAAAQNQEIRISSERQLDPTGTPLLLVYHLSLDVRRQGGETLSEAVADVRRLIAGTRAASELEDLLLAAGWLDAHRDRYRDPGYTVREHNFLEVVDDFPRVTEGDLRRGVGHVSYGVSVPVAKEWRLDDTDALTRLGLTKT